MIIKIHNRGAGCGSGPVNYLLGKDRDREDARLDRGNPDQMIELIDSINYAQRYKSGVLSFAESDLDEHQKQQIMDSFERTLLPGLDKDQYSILWVQHQDKDRLELNFVVANVELQSGKRLQPYFDRVDRPRLNAWKDLVNDYYGLKDPNDPLNKRELCTPNNLPKTKIKACEAITNGLLSVVERGDLKNRDDVIKTLETAGFEIARTTKKSISIKDPDGGQNIRLKGAIYEQDFRFSKELRADIERASEAYRADRSRRIQESRATLDRLTERKRESNQLRYPRAEQTPSPDYIKNLEHRSDYYRYGISPSMGDFGVSEPQDQQERRDYHPTESHNAAISRSRGQFENEQLHRQQEPQAVVYPNEYGSRQLERGLFSPNGILNDDRIRERITQSTGTDASGAKTGQSSLASDVREYTAGQSERQRSLQELVRAYEFSRPDPQRELEQISKACKQLERASTELQATKRSLDQAISGIRDASVKIKEINEPTRSYSRGWGL